MYAHVSREEWIWRGLAIATILALVGMAVMPAMVHSDACLVAAYALSKINDRQFAIGSGAITAGSMIITGLYTAGKISAAVAGWSGVGLGIAF